MRLLISCVNSAQSLIGFDWSTGTVFWEYSSASLRACGICYDHSRLLLTSDDQVWIFAADKTRSITIDAKHPPLLHGIHSVNDSSFGVVDAGNSVIRLFRTSGEPLGHLCPIEAWGDLPPDAIHLNDFAVTPHGLIASCFDYRPWRRVKQGLLWEDWCRGGFGLLINVSGTAGRGNGRIVGCGFNHPHSLQQGDPELLVCSSATGVLHRLQPDNDGNYSPVGRNEITREHFLRGLLITDKAMFFGGSTMRHTERVARRMAIYRLNGDGSLECKQLPFPGEIYDILPWEDSIMAPLIDGGALAQDSPHP